MAITALPTPPARTDQATFSARSDAFMAALPTFATEANALQADVNAKQVTASAAAVTATTQAGLAVTSGAAQVNLAAVQAGLATTNGAAQVALAAVQASLAQAAASLVGVSAWVTGTTYTTGDVKYSPIDYQMYRRKTDGAGSVDPSLDATNWVKGYVPTIETPMIGSMVEAVNSSADENSSWVFADGRSLDNASYPVAAAKFPPVVTSTTTRGSPLPLANVAGIIRTVNGISFKTEANNLYASSNSGVTWVLQMACPSGQSVTGIAYGNGIFMVMFQSLTTPYKSTTGMSGWTACTALPNAFTASAAAIYSMASNVAFGAGLFVIVGNDTTPSYCSTSADGVVWVNRSVDGSATQTHRSVVWCAGASKFVAVGGVDATNIRVTYSTDGMTWISSVSPFAFATAGAATVHTDGTNIVLMSGQGYSVTNFCHSTSATSWSSVALPASRTWSATGFAAGKFFATGYAGSPSTWYIVTSSTGVTWTETAMPSWPSTTHTSMQFAASSYNNATPICKKGSTWIIPSNQYHYWLSTDNGVTWTIKSNPTVAQYPHANANSSVFVLCGTHVNTGNYYSTDGISWTVAATPTTGSAANNRLEVANDIFFLLSTTTTTHHTSPDGNVWTARVCSSAVGARTAIYAAGLYFVQDGYGATGTTYNTSPTLATWTSRTVGGLSSYPSSASTICHDGTKFYCAGQTGGTSTMWVSSTDGITWSAASQLGTNGYGTDMGYYSSLIAMGTGMLVAHHTSSYSWITSNGGTSWVQASGYAAYPSRCKIDNSIYQSSGATIVRVDCLGQSTSPPSAITATTMAENWSGSPCIGALGSTLVLGFSGFTLRTTTDLSTWSTTIPLQLPAAGATVCAVAGDGTTINVYTSSGVYQTTDGATYTFKTPWAAAYGVLVFYNNGMYHRTESSSQTLSSSTDGILWTVGKVIAYGEYFYNVGYANGKWFAATSSTTGYVYSSTDGTTWAANATAPSMQFNNVVYTGGQYLFAATHIYSTPDLATWTQRSTSSNSPIVTPNSGTLSTQTGISAMESKDGGLTWTSAPGTVTATTGTTSVRMWGADTAVTNQTTGTVLHITKNGITYQQFSTVGGTEGAKGWKYMADVGSDLYAFTATATYKFTKSATQLALPAYTTTRKLVRIK